ncbi:tRNA-dependent cyclodipeptide synthase [Streptomyces sp. GbtcB6]|uniref:tRNA-dependent cyclodipeptide synthase n=1 Tax=Streptomyces sp. GbtcB6 TaxID=2824751 RepID=UPI0020C5C483|nr:tRNA-dependent cyclodipeptide synthase [Streptomyces sp. GbtcB6]
MTTASVLMADAFEIQPYTSHWRVIHDEGAHAVIGVSVGDGRVRGAPALPRHPRHPPRPVLPVCYHQRLPMAELLYGRGAGLRASRNQGHATVTPAAARECDAPAA